MEFLQIAANFAQILGVGWAIFFGSKAIFEVLKDVKVKKRLSFPAPVIITNILLSAILLTLTFVLLILRSSPTSQPASTSQTTGTPGVSSTSQTTSIPGVSSNSTNTPITTATITISPQSTLTATQQGSVLTSSTKDFNLSVCSTCSQPVHFKVNSIAIDSVNGAMTWAITLHNYSGDSVSGQIEVFTLTNSTGITYTASGLSQFVLQPGEESHQNAIFTFAPIPRVPYILSVSLTFFSGLPDTSYNSVTFKV